MTRTRVYESRQIFNKLDKEMMIEWNGYGVPPLCTVLVVQSLDNISSKLCFINDKEYEIWESYDVVFIF